MNNNKLNKLVSLLPECAFSTENYVDAPYYLYHADGDIDAAVVAVYADCYDGIWLSNHGSWCVYWLLWLKDKVSQQG